MNKYTVICFQVQMIFLVLYFYLTYRKRFLKRSKNFLGGKCNKINENRTKYQRLCTLFAKYLLVFIWSNQRFN